MYTKDLTAEIPRLISFFTVFVLLQLAKPRNRSDLQMREGIEDNSKIIFLISRQKIHCDPSVEWSP